MRIKIFACFTLLVLNGLTASGQNRLDSLYALLRHESSGNILVKGEDGFYVIGYGTDTIPWNSLGSLFTSFSYEGHIRYSTYTLDPGKRRLFQDLNAIVLDTMAYAIYAGTPPIEIFVYNIHNGEVLRRILLENKAGYPEKTYPYSMHHLDSNTILINSASRNYKNILVTQLSLLDIRKDSIRYYFNAYKDYEQNITDIILVPDGMIMGGYIFKGDPWGLNFVAHATLVWLDTNYVEIKRFISGNAPYEWHGYDMILDSDGSIISTNCPSRKYFDGVYHYTVGRPALFKVDQEGHFLWQRSMGRDLYFNDHSRFYCLIPSNLGDGYIAAGGQPNFGDSIYFSDGTLWPVPGENLRYEALIAKVSNDGDSLWSRWYYKADFTYSKSLFMDIIPHPAGGYLITGSANKEPLALGRVNIYTWLLHVDEYGCAVPGCHELVGNTDPLLPGPIRLYPNPATNTLYVYQQENEFIQYTIVDLTGRIQKEFSCHLAGTTAIIDVSRYPPGEYFLIRKDSSERIGTTIWVKL